MCTENSFMSQQRQLDVVSSAGESITVRKLQECFGNKQRNDASEINQSISRNDPLNSELMFDLQDINEHSNKINGRFVAYDRSSNESFDSSEDSFVIDDGVTSTERCYE